MAEGLHFVLDAEATQMKIVDFEALDAVSGGLSVHSFGAAPAAPGAPQAVSPGSFNPSVNPNVPFGASPYDPFGGGAFGGAPFGVDPHLAPQASQGGCHPCTPCHPDTSFSPGQAFDPFGPAGHINPDANVPIAAGAGPFYGLGGPQPSIGGVPGADPWANPFAPSGSVPSGAPAAPDFGGAFGGGPVGGGPIGGGGGFGGFGSPF